MNIKTFVPRRAALACGAAGLLMALDSSAQHATPDPGEAASACLAIESDQLRLACYDRAMGRERTSTAAADAAAQQARQEIEAAAKAADASAMPGSTRGQHSDLYASEPQRAIANAGKGSLLDSRWELARDSKLGTFNLRAYKPVYLLPLFWNSDPNTTPHSPNPDNTVAVPQPLDDTETKFQLSFKTKALENLFGDNGDVWMGYTQSSRWQVYNTDESRPFRETNYEPEVLLVFRNSYSLPGWKGRMAAVGVNHQSNGRGGALSRSWNRLMFNIGLDRDNWSLMLRPWYRLPESGDDDDNPDIEDYMGRADATLVHTRGEHEFALMARHSLRGGERSHGAVQFDWGFPLTHQLRGHLQVFDGYGESLIDYNHRATYVGLGVSLLEWY